MLIFEGSLDVLTRLPIIYVFDELFHHSTASFFDVILNLANRTHFHTFLECWKVLFLFLCFCFLFTCSTKSLLVVYRCLISVGLLFIRYYIDNNYDYSTFTNHTLLIRSFVLLISALMFFLIFPISTNSFFFSSCILLPYLASGIRFIDVISNCVAIISLFIYTLKSHQFNRMYLRELVFVKTRYVRFLVLCGEGKMAKIVIFLWLIRLLENYSSPSWIFTRGLSTGFRVLGLISLLSAGLIKLWTVSYRYLNFRPSNDDDVLSYSVLLFLFILEDKITVAEPETRGLIFCRNYFHFLIFISTVFADDLVKCMRARAGVWQPKVILGFYATSLLSSAFYVYILLAFKHFSYFSINSLLCAAHILVKFSLKLLELGWIRPFSLLTKLHLRYFARFQVAIEILFVVFIVISNCWVLYYEMYWIIPLEVGSDYLSYLAAHLSDYYKRERKKMRIKWFINELKPTEEEIEIELICPICYQNIIDRGCRTPCKHVYHVKCLSDWLKIRLVCPACQSQPAFPESYADRALDFYERYIIGQNDENERDAAADDDDDDDEHP